MRPTLCCFHSGSSLSFWKVLSETSLSRRVALGGDTPLCLIPYQIRRHSGADVGKLYKLTSSPCSAASLPTGSGNGKLLCNSFCGNTSSYFFFCFESQREGYLNLAVLILNLNIQVFQESFQQTIQFCMNHLNFLLPPDRVKVAPTLKENKQERLEWCFLNIPQLGLES